MSATHGEQVLLLEEHGQEGERSINWWGMMFFIASEASDLCQPYCCLSLFGDP